MINVYDLIGVRYRYGGRDLSGFDCYGLAIEVCRRFGHELPDDEKFKIKSDMFNNYTEEVLSKLKKKLKEVNLPEKEGDLILFNNGGVLSHIGVYLGDSKFIHCDKHGVHIEKIENRFDIGRCYTWL